jgi:hypothetical protein
VRPPSLVYRRDFYYSKDFSFLFFIALPFPFLPSSIPFYYYFFLDGISFVFCQCCVTFAGIRLLNGVLLIEVMICSHFYILGAHFRAADKNAQNCLETPAAGGDRYDCTGEFDFDHITAGSAQLEGKCMM